MKKQFKIHDFCFEIIYSDDIIIPENLQIFECQDEDAIYQYEMKWATEFPNPKGSLLLKRDDVEIYKSDDLETRIITIKGDERPYAMYEETSDCSASIWISEHIRSLISVSTVFISLLSLEKRILLYDAMILHCAYIEVNGEAILFSAPSETGKTTQATLWERYRKAETVNGDRALLSKKDGTWQAEGWPVCGTSEICRKKTLPIKAIVMLSQAKENVVQKEHPLQAFSKVYSQITINRWDGEAHQKCMDLIEQLINDVPIFHLGCTISEEAVECLEKVLWA